MKTRNKAALEALEALEARINIAALSPDAREWFCLKGQIAGFKQCMSLTHEDAPVGEVGDEREILSAHVVFHPNEKRGVVKLFMKNGKCSHVYPISEIYGITDLWHGRTHSQQKDVGKLVEALEKISHNLELNVEYDSYDAVNDINKALAAIKGE